MEIYCICLSQRRKHVEKFFERMNWPPPTFTDVTLINDLTEERLQELQRNGIITKSYLRKQMPGKLGKIACSMSHAAALRSFLQSGKSMAMIMEDDNHIPTSLEVLPIKIRLNKIIDALGGGFLPWHFCNLSPCLSTLSAQVQLSDDLFSGHGGFCMNAYLISKRGAEHLLSLFPLSTSYHTLDTFLPDYNTNYPFQVTEVHPRLFRQKDDHAQATLLANHNTSTVIGEFTFLTDIRMVGIISLVLMIPFTLLAFGRLNPLCLLLVDALLLLLFFLSYRFTYQMRELPKTSKITRNDYERKLLSKIEWKIRASNLAKRAAHKLKTEPPIKLYNPSNRMYRLGDIVHRYYDLFNEKDKEEIIRTHTNQFPDSIATQYLKTTTEADDLTVLHTLMSGRPQSHPPCTALVIHLRTGDVLDGDDLPPVTEFLSVETKGPNDLVYAKPLKYFYHKVSQIINEGITKIILVSGTRRFPAIVIVPCT